MTAPAPPPVPARRWLSALEFLAGAAVVIGHNVFKVVPSEVLILVVVGWISLRLRDGGWRAAGLRRPESWRVVIAFALAAAAVRIAVGDLVILKLAERVWPPAKAPELAAAITGNWKMALAALALVWVFAAFGEELAYRGYLLTRAADLGGRTPLAYWLAMVAVAALFGVGHYYKGPSGMLDSGFAGLVLGAAYLLSGRNLWVAILGHGFIDTAGVIVAYLGWE